MKTSPAEMIHNLKDREIREVLQENFIGSLAYVAHGVPYVLPVTYFYDEDGSFLISYSTEGHKIKAMRENPSVALGVYEMDTPDHWRSVMVHGTFEELHQIDAKACLRQFAEGVRERLQDKGIKDHAIISDFSSKAYDGHIPLVYRIRILEWTGKSRRS
ncbi:pyridoxamine 5'-phosphate oxidase family protein [Robiginitalea sp. SC105]|uniref:pyridoxamine 5'-phosphate oxidase family protein n=1 Tax=Robiginitalea sp. SC105 TaxID=2762332 RepID=UPI00163A3605|nr:pyridoxamine 5'-phosphate oxidase family protein [Robiginitalea sp. SC105]MBC2840261.1 pyridoxamine 5'-phosphate oxidase family protein [Robiginitalea sp. SC105]